jgi:hypothetical protein
MTSTITDGVRCSACNRVLGARVALFDFRFFIGERTCKIVYQVCSSCIEEGFSVTDGIVMKAKRTNRLKTSLSTRPFDRGV